ncbi:MAG: lipid-A-disaccharide synthase-related protein [Cyanobacteria bacterium J06598_1]
MSQRILFISNGHGEDDNSSHVIRTLRTLHPKLQLLALPIVGEGNAYKKLQIPIVGPTYILPSGGFTYMNRLRLIDDIRAGLLTMSYKQFRAMRKSVAQVDFVVATGDTVSQAFAYFSNRPFISNIACLSALYEGRLNMDWLLWQIFKSDRCKAVLTRDAYTAEDLGKQGLTKVQFGGIPSLDRLKPTGKNLQLKPNDKMVALLPGSRTAEAIRNFKLEMQTAVEIAQLKEQITFRAALVPGVMSAVGAIAREQGWQISQHAHPQQAPWIRLRFSGSDTHPNPADILCYSDAYSDIIHRTIVIGMAGEAVDKAVAIGKPVVQIPGKGPQFTYAFAEAQNRLLGLSAQTIGGQAATPTTLKEAAKCVVKTIDDTSYLQACQWNGPHRLGPSGGANRIASLILQHLNVVRQDNAYQVLDTSLRP